MDRRAAEATPRRVSGAISDAEPGRVRQAGLTGAEARVRRPVGVGSRPCRLGRHRRGPRRRGARPAARPGRRCRTGAWWARCSGLASIPLSSVDNHRAARAMAIGQRICTSMYQRPRRPLAIENQPVALKGHVLTINGDLVPDLRVHENLELYAKEIQTYLDDLDLSSDRQDAVLRTLVDWSHNEKEKHSYESWQVAVIRANVQVTASALPAGGSPRRSGTRSCRGPGSARYGGTAARPRRTSWRDYPPALPIWPRRSSE